MQRCIWERTTRVEAKFGSFFWGGELRIWTQGGFASPTAPSNCTHCSNLQEDKHQKKFVYQVALGQVQLCRRRRGTRTICCIQRPLSFATGKNTAEFLHPCVKVSYIETFCTNSIWNTIFTPEVFERSLFLFASKMPGGFSLSLRSEWGMQLINQNAAG